MTSRPPLLILLGLLSALGALCIDLYLPALTTVQADLDASAAQAQLTMGSFLVGLALGQLFYGPLSDRFGRKPVLLSGIVLYAATSLICALTPTIEILVATRFFQAFGAGAGMVLGRAIVIDQFPPRETARLLSLMAVIMLLGPLVAPIVGSHLLVLAGWRSCFWLLTGLGCIFLFTVTLALRETHPEHRRRALNVAALLKAYTEVISHRQSLGYVACAGFGGGAMFAYVISSPFIVIQRFEVAPVNFGYVHGVVVSGMIAGVLANSRLVSSHGIERLINLGLLLRIAGIVLLLALTVFEIGGLAGFVTAMVLCIAPNGMIMANVSAAMMSIFPQLTGTASAVLGAATIGMGAVVSAIMGSLAGQSLESVTIVMAGFTLASAASYWLLVRTPRREPP